MGVVVGSWGLRWEALRGCLLTLLLFYGLPAAFFWLLIVTIPPRFRGINMAVGALIPSPFQYRPLISEEQTRGYVLVPPLPPLAAWALFGTVLILALPCVGHAAGLALQLIFP